LFVEVRVKDRLYDHVVRLPETALYNDDTVYAVVDGRLVPRKVRVLARAGSDVVLRGDFTPGEPLVTTRFPEIGPGIKVTVE
jgi:multidrug efflux pump subunit AcrA (membrane-fusion protein)